MSKSKQLLKTQGNQVDSEPTLHDVIHAVNAGFSDIEARMVTKDEFNERFDRLDSRVSGIESKMVTKDELKEELAKMETRLVTKDYLDETMNDLRGDLTVSLRKEDQKVVTLVSILEERKVLSKKDAQRVMAMELFPRNL